MSWQVAAATLHEPLTAARQLIEVRDFEGALTQLDALASAHPGNLDIGVMLQDVELAVVRAGRTTDTRLALIAADADPSDALRRDYANLAAAQPSAAHYVLAARLETDALAAQNFLDRALELNAASAWAHYGMAHSLLRQEGGSDTWLAAENALSQALALDPGHLRARRLDAWMRVQAGATQAGVYALERWLAESLDDPRVSRQERHAAKLDLAIVWILIGEPASARGLLLTLEGDSFQRGRRLALLAAAEQATGDLLAALDSARRAEGADRRAILPAVQQALLFEVWFDDPARAERKWREVIDRAADQDDLSALLQLLRAQVRLERAHKRAAEELAASEEARE